MSLLIAIEGSISSGKSSLLPLLEIKFTREEKNLKGKHTAPFISLPEPLIEWKSYGEDKVNMLELVYSNPKEYAYLFQLMAYETRCRQLITARNLGHKRILMERTIECQKKVFGQLSYEKGFFTKIEHEILSNIFQNATNTQEMKPDFIIYLRTDPEKCFQRLQMRQRPEERNVSLEYLKELHAKYDQWLTKGQNNVVIIEIEEWFGQQTTNSLLADYIYQKFMVKRLLTAQRGLALETDSISSDEDDNTLLKALVFPSFGPITPP